MRYVIASRAQAADKGIDLTCHKMNDRIVILNEKELETCPLLSSYPTLEEKAAAIDGTVHSFQSIQQQLKNGLLI